MSAAEDAAVQARDALPETMDVMSPVDSALARDAMLSIDANMPPDAGLNAVTAAGCFEDIEDPQRAGPDYDQFDPIVGAHCSGTNHQDIEGVERVIFLGDSVSNGTPNDLHPVCLDNDHFFRVRLANWLSERFELSKGDPLEWEQWEAYSCLYDGLAGLRTSGDFWNCARWGARVDDFMGRVQTNNVPE